MVPTGVVRAAGRGSEDKAPFVAAVSLSDEGYLLRVKLTPVSGVSRNAIGLWAKTHLAPCSTVFSDGLACFGSVTSAGCAHLPTVVGGRKAKDLPESQRIKTVLGNLKTKLSCSYHAFHVRNYSARYLVGRFHLSVQPPVRSAPAPDATARGCRHLRAAPRAHDSVGWESLPIRSGVGAGCWHSQKGGLASEWHWLHLVVIALSKSDHFLAPRLDVSIRYGRPISNGGGLY